MEKKQIMTIEEVRIALKDRRLRVVAEAVGLSYPTIKGVLDGDTEPKYETIRLLSDYLQNGNRDMNWVGD
jgi:predicted transcriptional regulator